MPSYFESISRFFRIYNQMARQSVFPRIRDSHSNGTAFNRNRLFSTRELQNSHLPRWCRFLRCFLLATAGSALYVLPIGASTQITDISPEGFSVSSEGLPESAMDAWFATVRVEGRGVSWRPGRKCPYLRTRTGSGVVVKLTNDGRTAVIATNSHIVTCTYGAYELRVGFGDSSPPFSPKWSTAVYVVSRKPQKDLAILEVEIPAGAEIRAARFASPECCEAGVDSVISIGWPDLKVRKQWGVKPPPNYRSQIRRHSDGLLLLWLRRFQLRSEAGEVLDRLPVVFHNADVLPGSSGGPLTNRNGEVLGINTMIEGRVAPSDKHEFCASRDPLDPGECVHVAISSREVIQEIEQFYSSPIGLADCALPLEYRKKRQKARGAENPMR